MAKITVVGEAVVLTSTLKTEEIKMVQKYRPEALTLKNEDGEQYFGICTTSRSAGKINAFSIEFGGTTRDEEKLATVTLLNAYSADDGDIKELIADEVGKPVLNLEKLEATIPQVIEEILAEKATIMSTIEMM